MYRFRVYSEEYTLTSSVFDSLAECQVEFDDLMDIGYFTGGDIFEKVEGIGWAILNEVNNESS